MGWLQRFGSTTRARALSVWRDRALLSAVCIALLVCIVSSYAFFASRDDRGASARLTADAWYYHAYLPSLVNDRDLDFTNEYLVTRNYYRFGKTTTGRPANVFGIGPAVFELPFFLAGKTVGLLRGDDTDGFSTFEVKLSLLASLCFGLGAIAIAFRTLRRRLGGRFGAWLPALLTACGTPLVYYAVRQPGYAHPFAAFWTAAFIDAWDASFHARPKLRSQRTWIWLGTLLGLATLARPQCGLWGVILVAAVVDDIAALAATAGTARRDYLALLRRWALGALVCWIAVLPQLLAWGAMYGELFLTPQGPGFMRWDSPAWSEVLFSSRNGLLPWAPLSAIALIGLVASLRSHRRLGSALLIGFAAQTVANGAAWDWWAGGSFGGRRFDSCYLALAFGLGVALHAGWAQRGRRVATIAAKIARWSLIAVSLALSGATTLLASASAAHTVRIYGGAPASDVWSKSVPSGLGTVAAACSRAANWPARLMFSLRYDAAMDDYDYVVGAHLLGELYPGLNSIRDKQRAAMSFPATPDHRVRGIEKGVMTRARARILIPINRRGGVEFQVLAIAPAEREDAFVEIDFNGESVAAGRLGAEPGGPVFVARVRRGINVLDIRAPLGTKVTRLTMRATTDPLGR